MSIILDALRQAEREHRVEKAQVLDTICMVEEHKPSRKGALGWVIAALLVIALVFVTLFLPKWVSDHPPSPSGQVKTDSRIPHTKRKEPEKKIEQEQITQEGFKNQTGVDQRSKIQTSHSDTAVDSMGASVALSESVGAKQIPKKAEKDVERPSNTVAETPAGLTDSIDGRKATSPDAKELSTSDIEGSIPMIDDLPLATQKKIPKMTIMAHAYDEDPSKRFVFINGRTYRVGDRIGIDGPVLKEITPDALIIDYGTGWARVPIK